jgi:DNA modification methylase
MGGVASADELLIFRKPGQDVPVEHPVGFTNGYAGSEPIPADLLKYRGHDGDQKANRYSHHIWRRYASSVWDDVRLERVLPFRDARDEEDEKHVHPLQLDVIERYLDLRTMPGEKVLTPFMGVGSEVYAAVQMGRFAIGAELKPSYFQQALRNLAAVDAERRVDDDALFDAAEVTT